MTTKINRYRTEVKRSWWYTTLRSISMFCFSYWWLVWLMFLTFLVLWYFYCFRLPCVNCSSYQQINSGIALIESHLDSCCNCRTAINQQVPPNSKPCDYDETMSGGQGYKEVTHQLGLQPGTVHIAYDMLNLPDEMDVYYNDQLVGSTSGLVSGTGNISFYYPADPNKPSYCKIILKAPKSGTEWNYHIGCPR
jgi:hypothetical protein